MTDDQAMTLRAEIGAALFRSFNKEISFGLVIQDQETGEAEILTNAKNYPALAELFDDAAKTVRTRPGITTKTS